MCGTLTVELSTIAGASSTPGNSAAYGGGVYNGYFDDGGNRYYSTANLVNTIVAGNAADSDSDGPDLYDPSGYVTAQSCIVQDTGGNSLMIAYGNILGVAPLLAPLADNRGPTPTMALLNGSPALDAGDASLLGDITTDQRGQPRTQSGTVDIGAYEHSVVTPNVTLTSSAPAATVGQQVTFTATLPSDAGGTATFEDGNTPLYTATLSPSAASQALSLDGSGYVSGNTATGFPSGIAPAFSLAAWIRTRASDSIECVFSVGSWGYGYIGCFVDGGTLKMTGTAIGGSVPGDLNGTTNVADGLWHFVVYQQDGQGNRSLWVDGALDSSDSAGNYDVFNFADSPWTIGACPQNGDLGGAGACFTGEVAEPLLFARYLNATEVNALWNDGNGLYGDASVAPFNNGLAAGWNLDDSPTGTVVADFSGNGNDGQMNGGASLVHSPIAIPQQVVTYQTSSLGVGDHRITVVYSGDTFHTSAASDPLLVRVGIDPGGDAAVSAGGIFSRSGTVLDSPGNGPWTLTVDYGDGSGPQGVLVSANGQFALSRVYADAGTYPVTISMTDAAGNSGSVSLNVAVASESLGATAPDGSNWATALGSLSAADLHLGRLPQSRRWR